MPSSAVIERKRPMLVWLISVFFVISTGWSLFAFYLIQSGRVPLSAAQAGYFADLTAFDYMLTFGLGFTNLAGAVTLLLLKRVALYLFSVSLAVNVVMVTWHAYTRGWPAAVGGAGTIGTLIGWAILAVICFYCWRLTRRGVLQ